MQFLRAFALFLIATVVVGVPSSEAAASRASAQPAKLLVSPSGSDANRCTQSAPCLSLRRAYEVAHPGDVVQVADGSYSSEQILVYDPSKATAKRRVVFIAAPGAHPVFTSGIQLAGAQHVEFVGLTLDSTRGNDFGGTAFNRQDPASPRMTDVVFRNGKLQTFNIASGKDITIANSEIGNYCYCNRFSSNNIFSDAQGDSQGITLTGNLFHNITTGGATAHAECLFVKAVDGLTVTNNRFLNCPGTGLAFYDSATGHARNILVENNFMSCQPGTCYGGGATGDTIYLDSKGSQSFSNVTVRFNSSTGEFLFDVNASHAQNFRVYGNALGGGLSCPKGGSFKADYNVGVICGGTNRVKLPTFVDSSPNGDYDAAPGSKQIGAVPLSFCAKNGCPTRDIDGNARPRRWNVDAGADQRDPAGIVLGKTIGAARLGMTEAAVVAAYGSPRRVRSLAAGSGGPRLRLASYRLHGGQLWVIYDSGRVVGLGTSSAYYSTSGGLGPGGPLSMAVSVGFRPTVCRAEYRHVIGAVIATVTQAGRGAKKRVAAMWLRTGRAKLPVKCAAGR